MTAEARRERARALLRDAERVLVLTGAGISAESGVPTFRGAGGLWRAHRPEELATPEAFARDPELVWDWYRWRRGLVARCAPNAGHLALARHALERPGRVTIVTQNVDGLHGRAAREVAGSGRDAAPALPLELHGALDRDRCSRCGRTRPAHGDVGSGTATAVGGTGVGDEQAPAAPLPRCASCDGLLRPDVVWFGEALDPAVLDAAYAAARTADVCLVVGTSAIVHPAASLPAATLAEGGVIVEVNPERTPLTPRAEVRLDGPAAGILPLVL